MQKKKSLLVFLFLSLILTSFFIGIYINRAIAAGVITKNFSQAVEVLDERTENSKTFKNLDGTFTWSGGIDAIHYKEDYQHDAGWKEIDTSYFSETADYKLYDKMPIKVKVFKNKVGYEIESRRSGQKFTVELVGKKPNEEDIKFDFDIQPDRVRLWKTTKTDKLTNLKWKVTEKNHKDGLYSLQFRENPEAFDLADKDGKGQIKQVNIETQKIPIDEDSFYWEEKNLKSNLRIDTDVEEQVATGSDDGHANFYYDYRSTAFDTTSTYLYWGGNSTQWQRAPWMRFTNVNIPAGSTISSAILHVYVSGLQSNGDITHQVYANDVDDATAPTTYAEWSAKARTSNYVSWTFNWYSFNNTWQDSPNLGNGSISPVGEVLARAGWASGNDLLILVDNDGGENVVQYTSSYNGSSINAPKLSITYSTIPPGQVQNLHHTVNTTSTISWDWDDTADATGYKIYRTSDNVELADVSVSNWDQGSLSSNVQSTVYVKAYNDGGEGTASDNVSAYTSANPPLSPSHSSNTQAGITWTWNTNSNPSGTEFYASDSTGNSGWQADATSWNASSSHIANTQYTVSVKSRNGDGDETSTLTANAYTSIENVTGATWGTIGTNSIQLSGTGTLSNLSSGSSGISFRESVSSTNSGWSTTNSWAKDSLNPNTKYYFYITTRNGDGEANTEQGSYDKYTLASPVSNASAESGWSSDLNLENYITVSWNVSSATSVRIRCQNTATDIYTGSLSPYIHTNLPVSTLYTYRIYSRNGEGVENSSYVEVSDTTPPAQPQNLTFFGKLTVNSAIVTWDKVADSTGYILSYGTDISAQNLGEITIVGSDNTTYTFENLSPGVTYYVKVRATGSLGAWSNIVSFETQEASETQDTIDVPGTLDTGSNIAYILILSLIFSSVIFFSISKTRFNVFLRKIFIGEKIK